MIEYEVLWVNIQAFKSFKKETRVDLSTIPGFKFLGGINLAEPRLGANGSGKSTLWDAVLWCLYNYAARGQRAAELTAWGQSKPIVSAGIRKAGEDIVITRHGNPNKLFIDDSPAEQDDVDSLLGLSRIRFQHSVLFAQQVQLFPDLSVTERAVLLDEVCDLRVWYIAATMASDEIKYYESELGAALREEANADGQIKAIAEQDVEHIQELSDRWDADQQERIKAARRELRMANQELELAATEVSTVSNKITKLHPTDGYDTRISTGRQLVNDIMLDHRSCKDTAARNTKEIEFYGKHQNCPSCHQSISASHIRERRQAIVDENDQLAAQQGKLLHKASVYQKEINLIVQERDAVIAERAALREARDNARKNYEQKQASVRRFESVLANLSADAANPYQQQLRGLALQEQNARKALSRALRAQMRARGVIAEYDYWKTGFKKLRLFLVQRVLDYLTIETEAAAQALGLKGWTIEYATEVETKSGSMKQGVQIIVSSPTATGTWESWSGGEGQRIKLAVAMGLASLIQQMAGVNYKIEVFDEPSAWLSDEGIEDLLECLKNRAHSLAKSTWIIDHRSLNATSFDELWRVTKKRSGSVVERLR